ETESVDSMLVEFTDTRLQFGEHEEAEAGNWRTRSAVAAQAPIQRPQARGVASQSKGAYAPERAPDVSRVSHTGPSRYVEPGEDNTPSYGNETMWYYTVEEGQRALMIRLNGQMEVIVGPARVWKGSSRFEKMRHFVAHPGEFLIVRFRDGRQEHLIGPTDIWFDPRIHETITREDALQLAAKEAVIVYSRPAGADTVSRRIVHGPTLFVPAPGEWLH